MSSSNYDPVSRLNCPVLSVMELSSGEPVQVVITTGGDKEKSVELVEDAISKILLDKRVNDKKVVVISVVGTFRKGKSFLLDFFLRYMYSKDKSNWLGDPNEPLTGFHWRGGADRDTTGIYMWSEPFLVTLPSKEEVAVVFLDTQGSFDCRADMKQSATIFALSTMLSSKEIFNIKDNLQEDYLQHLQFFTEYGRIALEAGYAQTPFQVFADYFLLSFIAKKLLCNVFMF